MIKIDLKTAQSLYPTAQGAFKTMLEDEFGVDKLKPPVFSDRIKTFEDACKVLGLNPATEVPFKKPTTNRQKFLNAAAKLDIISEALLEGVILDWSNSDQKKWAPWFNKYTSGAGFRFLGSVGWWAGAHAIGGARLCVDTEKKSDYFGTQFLDIWNDYLQPIK